MNQSTINIQGHNVEDTNDFVKEFKDLLNGLQQGTLDKILMSSTFDLSKLTADEKKALFLHCCNNLVKGPSGINTGSNPIGSVIKSVKITNSAVREICMVLIEVFMQVFPETIRNTVLFKRYRVPWPWCASAHSLATADIANPIDVDINDVGIDGGWTERKHKLVMEMMKKK
eukprot:218713_1